MTHHIVKIGKELGTNIIVGKVKFDEEEVNALKNAFDILIAKNEEENIPGKVEDSDREKLERFKKHAAICACDKTIKIDYNFCCDTVNAINEAIVKAENEGLDGIDTLRQKMKEYQKLKYQLKK